MKKIFVLFLLLIAASYADAQLGGLLGKVKNKINQRVDKKENEAIDKTLDKAEGKTPANNPVAETTVTDTVKGEGLASYSKYDFVPGDTVIYAEDFSQEAMGELPAQWNSSGKGEVVTLNNFPGNWLKLGSGSSYLTANKKEFGKNFTVEFDLVLQLEYTGQYMPVFTFGFLSSGDLSPDDNSLLKLYNSYQSALIQYHPNELGGYGLAVSELNRAKYFVSEQVKTQGLKNYFKKISHVSMQVQEKRWRVWVNGEKLYDMPMAIADQYKINQLFFQLGGYTDPRFGYYISNLKAATGLPDTRHKLIEEGKFSTTGILFDVNKATIKPESYGVIKEIAGVLMQYKDIKIKIVGHTDSDGGDAANLSLSQKRAAAVKEALAKEFSIDGSRITTEGKGETEPVGDNKTKEGKIQNRRVEFIKN